jgi:LAS superfamily LD-carboxypeptidase LdcB
MKDKSVEGSYVKAILFARLGLADLARQEQERISPSLAMTSELGADNQRYSVVRDKDGFITKAFDSTGRAADDAKIAELSANSMGKKGVSTSQTMGFDKNGDVISHTVDLGTGRVIWTNQTTGKTLSSAPEGYHTGKNQQEMLANSAYLQSRRADETKNRNEVSAGRKPIFTDDQVEQRASENRNRILGLPTTTYGGGGEGGVTPAAATTGENAVQLTTRLGLPIVSGVRDEAKQQQLWDESVRAGRTGFMANGNPIAKPGTSKHENGMAVDGTGWTAEQKQIARANGLVNNVPGDPNHWELATPAKATTPQIGANNPSIKDVQQTNAQAIANYESPPLKGGGMNSQNATIMALVRQMNPDYDASKYDTMAKARTAFTTGKQGDTVRSMNVAIDHLDSLKQAADALHNKNIPVLNSIANEYAKQTGQPAPTSFDAMKTIVGSEVAKAIAGGATALGDREEIRKEISSANSPDQLADVIKKYQQLLGGQLKGLRTQYEDSGLRDFDKKLNPRTKKVLGTGENTNTRSNW